MSKNCKQYRQFKHGWEFSGTTGEGPELKAAFNHVVKDAKTGELRNDIRIVLPTHQTRSPDEVKTLLAAEFDYQRDGISKVELQKAADAIKAVQTPKVVARELVAA